jgi:hypothetical protein
LPSHGEINALGNVGELLVIWTIRTSKLASTNRGDLRIEVHYGVVRKIFAPTRLEELWKG